MALMSSSGSAMGKFHVVVEGGGAVAEEGGEEEKEGGFTGESIVEGRAEVECGFVEMCGGEERSKVSWTGVFRRGGGGRCPPWNTGMW
ncbi:MAG: hypothetical protein O3A87_03170 [Verrucomicrobia bacterium]|nr:hypothetical protein [Verrucomicrobiota bacterium]